MARLTSAESRALPSSEFAFPEARAYPLTDFGHAMSAIAYVDKYGTESEKKRVYAAVRRRFPGLHIHSQLGRRAPYLSENRLRRRLRA